VIASYPQLQPDHAETSALLLAQLSKQLGNSSYTPPASEPFRVEPYAVRVNALWFLSLVMSLVVSLFCILFKQWIRSYLRWTTVTPVSVAVGVRQYRYDGLRSWKFETTLTMLPVLMQAALIVFLGGLLAFAWNINKTIAVVVTVSAGGGVLILVATTILPILAPTSPYRTKATLLLRAFGKLVATIAKDLVHTTITKFRPNLAEAMVHQASAELIPMSQKTDHVDNAITPGPRVQFSRVGAFKGSPDSDSSWMVRDVRLVRKATTGTINPYVRALNRRLPLRETSASTWMVRDMGFVSNVTMATVDPPVRAVLDFLGPSCDESAAARVLPCLLASGPPVQGTHLYLECLWRVISALYNLSRDEVQSILDKSWPSKASELTAFFNRASPLVFLLLYGAFETAAALWKDWQIESTLLLVMAQHHGDRLKRTLIILTQRRLRVPVDLDHGDAAGSRLRPLVQSNISCLEAMSANASAGVFPDIFMPNVEGLDITFDGLSSLLTGKSFQTD
jgi:hypothetical protein